MKRMTLLVMFVAVAITIFLFIKRSIPYSDSAELLSTEISIDSIWSLGPTTAVYDRKSQKYYWLKSYTSLDQLALDTLKSKRARIQYMKFLKGPIENRIFRIEVDSVVVFDQVIER
ncbi:MAG TPA: hypothetical protein VFU05_03310 [Cyclobacteriaceae bacterium]|nr:hypothetical protein [Cyclobacteriaceae bacterium]